MKELSAQQIAAELGGHLGTAWPELRLLILFQADHVEPVEV